MSDVELNTLIESALRQSELAADARKNLETANQELNRCECAASNAWSDLHQRLLKILEADPVAMRSDLGWALCSRKSEAEQNAHPIGGH